MSTIRSILACVAVQKHIEGLKAKNVVDPLSLCSILRRKVSQSTNIRLGIELETIMNIWCTELGIARDIRPSPCKKGAHQRDFLGERGDEIIYAEFKSNINLDTEKRASTVEKVTAVKYELQIEYPAKKVKPYLVCLRYLRTADIPASVAKRYVDVSLIGIADFMEGVLGSPVEEFATYDDYSTFLMAVVDKLEPSSS